MDALASGMGAFLVPHLPRVFSLLMQSSLLACSASEVSSTAAHAWQALADSVPPRLLLPPLFAHLEAAVQVCPTFR